MIITRLDQNPRTTAIDVSRDDIVALLVDTQGRKRCIMNSPTVKSLRWVVKNSEESVNDACLLVDLVQRLKRQQMKILPNQPAGEIYLEQDPNGDQMAGFHCQYLEDYRYEILRENAVKIIETAINSTKPFEITGEIRKNSWYIYKGFITSGKILSWWAQDMQNNPRDYFRKKITSLISQEELQRFIELK